MNRREFLSQIPGYAAVPALLSLPMAKARPIRHTPIWLEKLEDATSHAKDLLLGPGNMYETITIYVRCPSNEGPKLEHLGRVNKFWNGGAPPGTLLIRGVIEPFGYKDIWIEARRCEWNTFFGKIAIWQGSDERVIIYPEVDFYSI